MPGNSGGFAMPPDARTVIAHALEPPFTPEHAYRPPRCACTGCIRHRLQYGARVFGPDGYDEDGYDRGTPAAEPLPGMDASWAALWTDEPRDRDGRTVDGYDAGGYDADGYDRNGFDADGWNADGFNAEGYDEDGRDAAGYDADGYDESGYDRDGRDSDGRDSDGYDTEGYDRAGYNSDGYDAEGYDRAGYDASGYDGDGYDRDGWNENGRNRYGDHRSARYCCESPQPRFRIRNDGEPPLACDTPVTVKLPEGVISAEGLTAIRDYLRGESRLRGDSQLGDLSYDLDELGDGWQTRGGNYAKRLSRLAYSRYGLKLTPEVMSQAGVIARDHSAGTSVLIEVTRQLNRSASHFANDESCWWGSYAESRCALKTSGGFALRSFDRWGSVSGRAWVMPLKLTASRYLTPTFETEACDAFVTFNGYGDLSGYAPARILSHLAGWTYRKIGFCCSPMYVNSGGYLVAAEPVTQNREAINLDLAQHSDLYRRERNEREELARVRV